MRLQKRRVLGSGVLGVGAALVLAGCGAGQITQTDTMLPAVNGALAQVGKLSVRNATLVNRDECQQAYTAGSSAPLKLTIANGGAQDDELISVSSANATNASIDGQRKVVAASTLVIGPAEQPHAEQAVAQSSSASPTSAAASEIGKATVTLDGLKSVVWPGQLTPVTFTFRDAGSVTVQLPIAAPSHLLDCQPHEAQGEGGH